MKTSWFPFLFILILSLAALAVPLRAGDFMVLLDEEETAQADGGNGDAAGGVLIKLDAAQLASDPAQISIPLPEGRVLIAFRSADTRIDATGLTWSGQLQTEGSGAAILAPGLVRFYQAGGLLYGTVRTEDGAFYELQPEGELHRLVRFAPSGGGDSCGVGSSSREGGSEEEREEIVFAGTTETDCAVPANTTTITVMVLYPRNFSASQLALTNYVNTRISEANSLFVSSDVKIQYQLAHLGLITGEQPPVLPPGNPTADITGPVLAWLNAQFATAAVDTEVEILRRAYAADMVVVLTNLDGGSICGRANLPENLNGNDVLNDTINEPFSGRAFSVVKYTCGNGDYTFAHEMAHTLGMWHNTPQRPRIILPWAYGFLFTQPSSGTVVSDVMGCAQPGVACSRIPLFSNPDKTWQGVPVGLHSGPAFALGKRPAHNACVGNLRRTIAAAYASPPPSSPPSLSITGPAHGATVTSPGTLTGTASDPQNGNLTASIQWTSDRQGALGSASPLNVVFTRFGPHRITAKVTDSSGVAMVKSIDILVSDNIAPQRYVDSPAHNQMVTGNLSIVLWALDDSGVPNPPTFQVDGQPATVTSLVRSHRMDVCAAFPTVYDPNCPMVGWTGTLDTSQLPNGSHTLTVTVKDPFNNTGTFNRTFRTQNTSTAYLYPTADAWVSQANPTTNYGSAVNLEMRATGSGLARHAYLKFDLSQVTRPPISAVLGLYTGTTAWPATNVYRLATTSWNEYTVNWNNGPLDPLYYLALPGQPANSFTSLNVTSMFPSGGGLATLGIVTTDNPGHYFIGKDVGPGGAIYWPYLEITY